MNGSASERIWTRVLAGVVDRASVRTDWEDDLRHEVEKVEGLCEYLMLGFGNARL